VLITNPANGSTVGGEVAITVTADDNVKVSRLSLSIDGKEVAVALNSGTLSYSWSTTSTATTSTKTKRGGGKGKTTSTATTTSSSTIVAKAQDPAGNTATTSITVKR